MVVSINARACGYFGDRIQVTKMAVTRNIETVAQNSVFTLNSMSLQPGSYFFESQRLLCTTVIFRENTDDVLSGMTVCWYVRSPINLSSTFTTHSSVSALRFLYMIYIFFSLFQSQDPME